MWTNAQDVRDLLNVDIDTADDEILEEFIQDAQVQLKKYIQIDVMDEILSGSINGINCSFSVANAYLADTNFDGAITTADFKIYGWPNSDNPLTRVELSVSTFDALRGIFVLATAPLSTEYEQITCDYSYYTKAIDWDLLSQACKWKAAELWVKREEYLVPERIFIGTKRIYQSQPWKYFEYEVRRLVDKLVRLPMDKVAYSRLVFSPRTGVPEVDSTATKEVIAEGGEYSKPDLT